MADIPASNWNEADASNSTAAPDGWPEGMAPSGVNDSGRAMMGAVKRWYDQTVPLVTGGTSTAYTLTYSVAPGALVDGMTHLVQFNAVNGAAATLNVNALGAKPLHFWASGGWGAFPANMVAIDQIVRVAYNAAAGTYRAITLPMTLRQNPSGVSTVDFTGIPTTVNELELRLNVAVSSNPTTLALQFYNSGGSLDTGANYFNVATVNVSGTVSGSAASGQTSAGLGSFGTGQSVQGSFIIGGIQSGNSTLGNGVAVGVNSGNNLLSNALAIGRLSAGSITGVRILGGAVFTGSITLIGR